jgi:inner membrane protein involved in colicin E2 resistance
LATRRTLLGFGWIIGFFLLILLFGFLIAVPLMVFLFLKVQAKERWGISLLLTGLALVFFYGLFIWLLSIPFPVGWILEGLKMPGLG